MAVEVFWRIFKRLTLGPNSHARLDFATRALISEAIPTYRHRFLKYTDNNPRIGRAQSLTAEQAACKKSWTKLSNVKIKGTYNTDCARWTCDCGHQKYHTHLLCKHLVQAIPRPPDNWWPKMIRYSVPPFYIIPGVENPLEPEKITDYGWLPRRGLFVPDDQMSTRDAGVVSNYILFCTF
jgi:hypothetical protein